MDSTQGYQTAARITSTTKVKGGSGLLGTICCNVAGTFIARDALTADGTPFLSMAMTAGQVVKPDLKFLVGLHVDPTGSGDFTVGFQ